MLQQRSQVEAIAERIGPDSFQHPLYRQIFAAMLEHGEGATMDELANDLDADALDEAQEMLSETDGIVDMQRTIDDSITQLHVLEMEHRLTEIDGLLPLANEREKEALQQEKHQLVLQMRASGKKRFKAFRR
jgi:replicative DNA helicase